MPRSAVNDGRRVSLRLAPEAGGVLPIIDATGERAARWYASFGAEPLRERPLTLVMPLATCADGVEAGGWLERIGFPERRWPDRRAGVELAMARHPPLLPGLPRPT